MTETTAALGSGRQIDQCQAAAFVAQLLLIFVLAFTAGVGVVGCTAGVVHAIGLGFLVDRATRRMQVTEFGPADVVTLARAVLGGGITAIAVENFGDAEPSLLLVTLAVIALALDSVDGRVARRTHTSSAFGARFDMEADSYIALLLSIYCVPIAGPLPLVIGLMRYLFWMSGFVFPWLKGELPPRKSAKHIAALQGIVLTIVAANILPNDAATAVLVGSIAALVWSFANSVQVLVRRRVISNP